MLCSDCFILWFLIFSFSLEVLDSLLPKIIALKCYCCVNLCIHIPFKENSACKNYSNTRGKLLFARLFECHKFARLGSCIMDLLFKPHMHIMALYMASDSQVMFSYWHFLPNCALSVYVCCVCMHARHETKLPLGIDPCERERGG